MRGREKKSYFKVIELEKKLGMKIYRNEFVRNLGGRKWGKRKIRRFCDFRLGFLELNFEMEIWEDFRNSIFKEVRERGVGRGGNLNVMLL